MHPRRCGRAALHCDPGVRGRCFREALRLSSLLTIAVVFVFGAWTNSCVPLIAAEVPAPLFGVAERIMLGAFLLWVVVFAVVLLRGRPGITQAVRVS
jgi:hypothetical protein